MFSLVLILCEIFNGAAAISGEEYALMPPLFRFDDYEKCMLYGDNALYCTFTFQLRTKRRTNENKIWILIKNASSKASNYRHDLLRHGVCVTETCPNATKNHANFVHLLTECVNKKFKTHDLEGEIVKMHCQDLDAPYSVDNKDILFISFILLYVLFIIGASLYEGTARYKSRKAYKKITETSCGKLLSAFSIPKNFHRLRKIDLQNPLGPIQGIRFYNMILIILAHIIMIQFASPVSNPLYTETMTTIFLNSIIANGGYAVQTFFLISGWLLCYNIFESFTNRKFCLRHTISAFILRYLRLTPTLALVVGFHSTWLAHLTRGPFWDKIIGDEYRNCRKNWWTNLLYINNYVNNKQMCLQQTWYLATDTQLFIVALIVIYFMKKYEKFALQIVGIAMAIGVVIPFVVAYVNDYDILVRQYPEPLYDLLLKEPHWHVMYTASYSNITGYMMGVLFGYLYHKIKGKKIVVTKIYVTLWWIISFGFPISIIMVAGRMYQDDFTFTPFQSALYWALGKNIFALGIAVGIFGMALKIGWFVLWILRWTPAQILGRLTFNAYLVHVGLIKLRASLNRQPIYVNNFSMLHCTLGDVTLAYLVAFVVTLMVEMPISALQKIQMGKKLTD